MSEELRMAISVLWPAAAASGAIMLLAWWPRWQRQSHAGTNRAPTPRPTARPAVEPASGAPIARDSHRGWASALALGGSFAMTMLLLTGGWPIAQERWHSLFWVNVAACVAGIVTGFGHRAPLMRLGAGTATAIAAALLLQPLDSVAQPLAFRAIIAGAVFAFWWCMEGTAQQMRGFSTPLSLAIIFAGLALIVSHGHWASLSLLAGGVALSLMVVAGVATVLPPLSLACGGSNVLAALLAGLAAVAWMYEAASPPAVAILASAPVLLHLVGRLVVSASPWLRFALRLLCTLVPAALAVVVAINAAPVPS